MDLAAARQRGTQLNPRNDLHSEAFTGGTRLADTGDRVVIGERQDAHATRSGLLHQHRGRKEAVRVGAMRVEIDLGSHLSRGDMKSRRNSRTTRLLDSSTRLPWLHDEPDGSAVLVLDDDVDEGWQTDRFDPGFAQVVPRDGDRLDRLVSGAGADRLHLGPAVLADDARDRPGNRARPRPGRDFQDIAVAVLDERHAVGRGDRAITRPAIGVGLNILVLILVLVGLHLSGGSPGRRVRLARAAQRWCGDLCLDAMVRTRLDDLFGVRWITRVERIDLDVTQVELGEEAIHVAEPPEHLTVRAADALDVPHQYLALALAAVPLIDEAGTAPATTPRLARGFVSV